MQHRETSVQAGAGSLLLIDRYSVSLLLLCFAVSVFLVVSYLF